MIDRSRVCELIEAEMACQPDNPSGHGIEAFLADLLDRILALPEPQEPTPPASLGLVERMRRAYEDSGMEPSKQGIANCARVAADAVREMRGASAEIADACGGQWGSESQDNGAIIAASRIRALPLPDTGAPSADWQDVLRRVVSGEQPESEEIPPMPPGFPNKGESRDDWQEKLRREVRKPDYESEVLRAEWEALVIKLARYSQGIEAYPGDYEEHGRDLVRLAEINQKLRAAEAREDVDHPDAIERNSDAR